MFSLRMTRSDFSDALLYVYTQIELLTIETGLSIKRYFFGDPAVLKLKGRGSKAVEKSTCNGKLMH